MFGANRRYAAKVRSADFKTSIIRGKKRVLRVQYNHVCRAGYDGIRAVRHGCSIFQNGDSDDNRRGGGCVVIRAAIGNRLKEPRIL